MIEAIAKRRAFMGTYLQFDWDDYRAEQGEKLLTIEISGNILIYDKGSPN